MMIAVGLCQHHHLVALPPRSRIAPRPRDTIPSRHPGWNGIACAAAKISVTDRACAPFPPNQSVPILLAVVVVVAVAAVDVVAAVVVVVVAVVAAATDAPCIVPMTVVVSETIAQVGWFVVSVEKSPAWC